ncbi:MAG: thermonuclease family protein [Bacilli bacterium]
MKRFIIFLLLIIASLGLASCKTTDPTSWDYVRDQSLTDFAIQATLNENNLNSDFDVTGRGYVTVETFIDGDTVHFRNYSKTRILKVRFIAIDTPESTGKVEPWGKPASLYTKSKLEDAQAIVLESNEEGNPVFDSTGERYLAWVWYQAKDSDVWRNLNVEILQDGLAMGKNSSSNRYGTIAQAALTDARANDLNLYSGENDPLFFYGETVELTIKALVTNKDAYNGIKVRFEGVVTKVDGNAVYIEQYDEDANQAFGVYVYGGYASLAPRFLVVGYQLIITGTADNNENFGFQVSGLSFSLIDPTVNDVVIVAKNVETTPTLILADELLTNEYLDATYVKMENLQVVSIYTTTNDDSSSQGAMTLTCQTADQQTIIVRTVVLMSNNELVTEEYFQNKTITVIGIVNYFEGVPQIQLFNLNDVTIIQ